ncbi:lipid A deacylase LpxR family protein [Phenylobacterium sp. J426]|uniref:lipid A deacylase LpxR family protein n=1 Tax=Phenylobacterium sp. J426 TaxID=2898439 RepID=UPI002151AE82|nr:lipid A deacylase LpxR family protein [Phenylobacterium sp. J426]MCR5873500.1 lipid A deacylase LpxR family protein [Phenylobacterium sp. J426]
MVRRTAVMAAVLGCGAATAAAGQDFAPIGGPRDQPLIPTAQAQLAGAAFIDRETYASERGLTRARTGEMQLNQSAGAVDSLRISTRGSLRTQGGLPLNLERGEFANEDYDVTLIRSWPRAINFSDGKYEFDVSPHAGVGVGSRGGSAEAGAMLTVGQKREKQAVEALKDIGVREGSEYGDRGRWYLFAAASGRAVGLNMLRNEGDWSRGNWTTDDTGELVGDAHIGVGWRKGDMQSSFGVVHREVKGNHMVFGQHTRDDTVAAFTFSIRPQK